MEQPAATGNPSLIADSWALTIKHPGGVGDILLDADGGSWLRGVIAENTAGPALHYSPQ